MKTVRNVTPSNKTPVRDVSAVWGQERRKRKTRGRERKRRIGVISFQHIIAPCYRFEICPKSYFEKYGHPMRMSDILINYNNHQKLLPYVQAFLMMHVAAYSSFVYAFSFCVCVCIKQMRNFVTRLSMLHGSCIYLHFRRCFRYIYLISMVAQTIFSVKFLYRITDALGDMKQASGLFVHLSFINISADFCG